MVFEEHLIVVRAAAPDAMIVLQSSIVHKAEEKACSKESVVQIVLLYHEFLVHNAL